MTYNVNFSPTRYLKCTNATRLKICLTTDNTLNTFYYHIAIAFVIFFSCKETLCTPCISFSFLIPLKKLMFILSSSRNYFFLLYSFFGIRKFVSKVETKNFFSSLQEDVILFHRIRPEAPLSGHPLELWRRYSLPCSGQQYAGTCS